MSPREEGQEAHVQRELDFLHSQIESLNKALEAQRAVTVDLQVRVAQLEVKQPVGKDEFDPIKRLVWGFVGTVLAVVLVAILAIVVNKTGVPITSIKPI